MINKGVNWVKGKAEIPVDASASMPDRDNFFQKLLDHERRWKDRE
jgi:hypothetical protein